MIAEISQVMQDEALLADVLKIIAGEPNGLTKDDRDSLRKSALLLDEVLKSYGTVLTSLYETQARLVAAEERLRETALPARWSI